MRCARGMRNWQWLPAGPAIMRRAEPPVRGWRRSCRNRWRRRGSRWIFRCHWHQARIHCPATSVERHSIACIMPVSGEGSAVMKPDRMSRRCRWGRFQMRRAFPAGSPDGRPDCPRRFETHRTWSRRCRRGFDGEFRVSTEDLRGGIEPGFAIGFDHDSAAFGNISLDAEDRCELLVKPGLHGGEFFRRSLADGSFQLRLPLPCAGFRVPAGRCSPCFSQSSLPVRSG